MKFVYFYFLLMGLFFFNLEKTWSTEETQEKEDTFVIELQDGLEEQKKHLEDYEIKQRQILSSLYEINREINKNSRQKNLLTEKQLAAKAQIRKLLKSISDLDEDVKRRRDDLSKRLTVMYKLGISGTIQLIFSSKSGSQLDRNLKYLNKIIEHDVDLIKTYIGSKKKLQEDKIKLSQELNDYKTFENELVLAEKNLDQKQKDKKETLNSIQTMREEHLEKIKELTIQASVLSQLEKNEKLIDHFFSPSLFDQKGKLSSPVQGDIIQKYGLISDSETDAVMRHKGLFYGTKKPEKVKSVFAGQIEFLGDVPGFGQTIVIAHGDHYYSVYSYLSKSLVARGDPIKKGSVIALSGQRSELFGPGLYFEIRHFSEPQDPSVWIAQ